ncbi:MAG: molybdate ABC transporter substrate-binding protein [Chloroflexi bacterium]|nr:molybdate ABC transporter substrate-binding protein [Chloroflexota bacterium]
MRPSLHLLLLILLLLTSCQSEPDKNEIAVFAASSLTDSFNELATAFEANHTDTEIVFNFASSSQLAAQILEGARADVFASANEQQMQLLEEAGLVEGTSHIFATNRLVLITPEDNPADIQQVHDLARANTRFVTAVRGVPIREYTETLLAEYTEYDAIIENIVSEEANVRQVVLKVALGEADAAIVYATDVTADLTDQIRAIQLDAPTIPRYHIASLNANAFTDFVLSDEGQAILQKWGFDAP